MLVKTIVRCDSGKQGWHESWRLERADILADRSMVRYRKHAARKNAQPVDLSAFPPHDDPRELLRLFGFFLGDGYAGRDSGSERNTIHFHLRRRRKINWLSEVCVGLGWTMDEKASVIVRAPGVTGIFRKFFYDENGEKIVPDFLLDLSRNDAEAVLDGLRNSDGSEKRSTWSYSTTSHSLAQALQLIGLHAGLAVHIGEPAPPKKPEHKPLIRLMVLSRMREPVINQGKRNTFRVPYDGMIYCASTRTGVLVVRRNGKIVLSGNSTPFEFAGLAIEVQAPIMVFREWHRHRTQSFNEMSGRYVQMPDLHYIPSADRIRAQSKTNKQGSGDPLADDVVAEFRRTVAHHQRLIYEAYEAALAKGIAKEIARINTPVSRYSRMRASANLRNWLAFLTLRSDEAAQWEIREYANAVGAIIAERFPRTWALFVEGREHEREFRKYRQSQRQQVSPPNL